MGNIEGGGRLEVGRQGAHHYRPKITNFPSMAYPGPWVCSLGLESLPEKGQVLKDTHVNSSLALGLHCFLTLCKALASLRLSPHPNGEN